MRFSLVCLQGENQAGVLHVQPHVWGDGEEEPGGAWGGLLHPGGLLVHQEDTVLPNLLTQTLTGEFSRDSSLNAVPPSLPLSLPLSLPQAWLQHARDLGRGGSSERG